MTLYTVSSGGIIQAGDINQSVNWLQNFAFAVWDYGMYPSNTAAQNDTALANLLSTLPACSVYDGGNNLVAGKTGTILFGLGVYQISSLITLPPGIITIQGSGPSSWIPIESIASPTQNLGGTVIVTTNTTNGLLSVPKNVNNQPATVLFLRDLELRTVSPASPGTLTTPPILDLTGWLAGEISNVNVLEVAGAGGIGNNLYKLIDCSPGGARDSSTMLNVRAFGGNIPITFAGAHIIAIGITCGQCTTSIASWASAMDLQFDLGCYYADLHVYSAPYGLSLASYQGHVYSPSVIYGVMFESTTHYMRQDFGGQTGTIIIESPCWNTNVDPLTDIPANMTTLNVITKYEQHEPTSGSQSSKHVTVASSSQTAGTSPYTLVQQPYDQIAVITTVGGITALSLDGQALFNSTFSIGQQVYVGAGHTLIATWATTAPVFKLLPL